jgi:flagellar hook-basal body complex protein FliE
MSIEAIGPVLADIAPSSAVGTARTPGSDFANLLGEGLSKTDMSLKSADMQLRQLAAGADIPVHDIMISMEKARLDLMLVVEVRNRIVEGYQELMRMQL